MAYKITAICDKCKKEETQEKQYFSKIDNQWRDIELKVSDYNRKEYLLCLDCQKALGLIKPENTEVQPAETVGDRLINCIAEIVADQAQG